MTPQDERAFEAQMSAVASNVLAFARSLTGGDVSAAGDLAQDTMLKAWGARDRFELGTNMRAWLFTIARNCRISQIRHARFTAGYVADLPLDMLPSIEAGQEGPIHYADTMRAFGLLSVEQQDAVGSVALGFAYDEVALATGCATGTIKSRVARGRAVLVGAS